MSVDFAINVSIVASIVFFFFSLAQLVHKDKPLSNYFLAVIFFSIGIQGLSLWLYAGDSHIFYRYFLYSDSAFLFLLGPFLYLFFLYTTTETGISWKKVLLHSLPFVLSLIVIEALNFIFPDPAVKGALQVFQHIVSTSYLVFFFYLIGVYRLLYAFCTKEPSRALRFLIFITIFGLFSCVLLILSNTLLRELQFIGDVAFICISLLFIFFLIRYPHYFSIAQKESRERRYRRSQIEGLNKQRLIEELDLLMEKEKIHLDRSVSLEGVSRMLDISPSQLSELLNSHYKAGFNSFINAHRVEEAKILLQTMAGVNILEVAFECGFNSKSTFNTAFRKFTGLTPSEYKKQLSL